MRKDINYAVSLQTCLNKKQFGGFRGLNDRVEFTPMYISK